MTHFHRSLRASLLAVALTAAGLVAVPVASSAAAPPADPSRPGPRTALHQSFGVAGDVWAMARAGDVVYLGGQFNQVQGQRRRNLAAVDLTTGTLTNWDPGVGSDAAVVKAIAVSPSGDRIYVGGHFTALGGEDRANVGAVAADGSATDWNPGASGDVDALAVASDGATTYAGGEFTTFGGDARSHLAAADDDGAVTDWDPGATGPVHALQLNAAGDTLWVGGSFTTLGGQSRSNIGAVGTDSAAATAWNVAADGAVNALAVAPAGDVLYATGDFGLLGGLVRGRVGAFTTAGVGSTSSWYPGALGASGEIPSGRAITVDPSGSFVYLAGRFDTVNSTTLNNIAAIDAAGAVRSWFPNTYNRLQPERAVVRTAITDPDRHTVLVGGTFDSAGTTWRDSFAALVDTSLGYGATAMDVAVDNDVAVHAMLHHGDRLYVGGTFSRVGGLPRQNIAMLDAKTGVVDAFLTTSVTATGRRASVEAIETEDPNGTIFLGGDFDTVGGAAHHDLAGMSSGGTVISGFASVDDATGGVVRVLHYERRLQTLYAGGDFTSLSGSPREGLAALDVGGVLKPWDPILGSSGSSPSVTALVVDPSLDRLFVGGSFATVGGAPRSNLAEIWTGPSAAPTPWSVGTDGIVRTLEQDWGSARLYIGGDFRHVDGMTRRGIASATTAGTGGVTAWNPNVGVPASPSPSVRALTLSPLRTSVVLAGEHVKAGGGSLAAVDTVTGADRGWSPSPRSAPGPILTDHAGEMLVGGLFTAGASRSGFAEYTSVNSDVLPDLSVAETSVVEGDRGDRLLRFTLALSRPSSGPTSVLYQVFPKLAQEGPDFVARHGRLTIPPGQTTAVVPVVVKGDVVNEYDKEDVELYIWSVQSARLKRSNARGTILDDEVARDALPRFGIGDSAIYEGDRGDRLVRFSVELSYPSAVPTSVWWRTVDGGAHSGSDYRGGAGLITLPPGALSAVIAIPVIGDTTQEGTEGFRVELFAPTGAVVRHGTGHGVILEDDAGPSH